MPDQKSSIQSIAVYSPDYLKHVCPVIRIFEPLEAAGFTLLKGSNWEAGKISVDLEPISAADCVLISRDFPSRSEQYPEIIQLARSLGKPVIYELDDLLMSLPGDHPDVDYFLPIKPGIIRGVMDADAVTVTTTHLRDALKPFNPNIHVLPNFLLDRIWSFRAPRQKKEGPVVIGYMGGHGHKPDLDRIMPALEAILDKYGEAVELMFWGIRPKEELFNRPNVRWTHPYLAEYDAFAQYFLEQEADIFIAPLQDNVFNRCKSALKFLEYSAVGIPGVYSGIPPYTDVVEPGVTGLLACTMDEWVDALSRLIDSADLRASIGEAAQEKVKHQYLLSSNAFLWKDAYKDFTAPAGAREPLAEFALARDYLQNWYEQLAEKHRSEKALKEQQIRTNEALKVEYDQLAAARAALNNQYDALNAQHDRLQADYEKLGKDLENARGYAASVANALNGIVNSRGWKMLQLAYNIRLKVAPRGSRRERAAFMGYRALSIAKNEGVGSLVRRAKDRGQRRFFPGQAPVVEEPKVTLYSAPGTFLADPAFSLVVRLPEFQDKLGTLQEWIASQTFRSVEVVLWDTDRGEAWKLGREDIKYTAADLAALKPFLNGNYVYFASADLLAQNATYLETNIVALETEALLFTVNVSWDDRKLAEKIRAGAFPGSPEQPFFRQFVAKEALGDDLTLDFSGNPDDAFVAGKILYTETSQADDVPSWPFAPSKAKADFVLENQWVIYKRPGAKIPFPIQHCVRPIESLMLPVPEKTEKPVILVLMQFLAVGGAERLLLKIIETMKDRFTFVIVCMEQQPLHSGTTADGFRKLTPYVYSLAYSLSVPLNFSAVSHLITRFQPVSIYIHNGSNWMYDALAEIRRRFPSTRIINQVYDHQYGWINRYDPVVVNSIDGHISANQKISQAYLEKGARQDQVYFIEHCIDMNEVDPARYSEEQKAEIKAKLGLPQDKRIVAFIARFHPQKRPMDYVELARRNEANPDLHFLMVGEGPLSSVVAEYVAKNKPKNLTVHAFYRPITDIYAIMDALVLPSEYEAMPLVVLEAQAMGKPVIVTDVGSNRDVVEDTCGGVVVAKIGDIKGLSDGIETVFKQPIDSAKVRDRIRARFGTEYITSLYQKALLGE